MRVCADCGIQHTVKVGTAGVNLYRANDAETWKHEPIACKQKQYRPVE